MTLKITSADWGHSLNLFFHFAYSETRPVINVSVPNPLFFALLVLLEMDPGTFLLCQLVQYLDLTLESMGETLQEEDFFLFLVYFSCFRAWQGLSCQWGMQDPVMYTLQRFPSPPQQISQQIPPAQSSHAPVVSFFPHLWPVASQRMSPSSGLHMYRYILSKEVSLS